VGGRTTDLNRGQTRVYGQTQRRKSDPDELDPDDLVAIFGANLKTARMRAGLTQAQLAEQSGLLQQYVSLVESGKQMSLSRLHRRSRRSCTKM